MVTLIPMEHRAENFSLVLTPGLQDTGWIHDLEVALALAFEKEGLPLDWRELQILIGGVVLAACGNRL